MKIIIFCIFFFYIKDFINAKDSSTPATSGGGGNGDVDRNKSAECKSDNYRGNILPADKRKILCDLDLSALSKKLPQMCENGRDVDNLCHTLKDKLGFKVGYCQRYAQIEPPHTKNNLCGLSNIEDSQKYFEIYYYFTTLPLGNNADKTQTCPNGLISAFRPKC